MPNTIYKAKSEIPTIDCALVTISIPVNGGTVYEFGFETADQIEVEPQTEEQEAIKLIIKGKLKAQKKKHVTVTGNQITLHDNVFDVDLVIALQGGTATYDQTTGALTGYTPPVLGSNESTNEFELNAYSAQYNAAGQIVNYEKITYPHCTGNPVAFNSQDNVFRATQYVIDSAPNNGEAPYTITYVSELPTLSEPSTATPTTP